MFFDFENASPIYVGLIGDIKDSRKLPDRQGTQDDLKEALEWINVRYEEDISSRLTITLGDEFQGLFRCGRDIMGILDEIEYAMRPVSLRFGIGAGPMSTDIAYDFSIGSDGPAYHRARESIDFLKVAENSHAFSGATARFDAGPLNDEVSSLVNSLLTAASSIKGKWTTRQWDVVMRYRDGVTQEEIASELGIGQSSVSAAIVRADLYAYREISSSIQGILSKIGSSCCKGGR